MTPMLVFHTASPAQSFEEMRDFLERFEQEIRDRRFDQLRPHAALLRSCYLDLEARLARARKRTGLSARELGFSEWVEDLRPLFVETPLARSWMRNRLHATVRRIQGLIRRVRAALF